MSDPSRLRDDIGTDGFELALLRSAAIDREPDDGAARALAVLGVAATAGAVGLASSSTAQTAGATSSAATVAGSAAGGAAAAKVFGVVLLSAVAITGAVLGFDASRGPTSAGGWGAGPTSSPSSAPVVAAARSSVGGEELRPSVDSAPAPSAIPEGEGAVVGVADLPSVAPDRATVPSSRGTSPREISPSAAVSEELALIDQARAAIARGDGAGAEESLDRYEGRFPNGSLVLEAKLARIELLLARSDSAGALDLGERFLREHPRTPYERRVRVLVRRARSDATSR
ncbi:MAG: outer membrane protein assembly factor BamD [Labilithrix sp.]|nr:outer membrane protein assembly factor BamD [Labilithrix sp.]